MVNGGSKGVDIGIDCISSVLSLQLFTEILPVSSSRLPEYSRYKYGSAPCI